MPTIECTKCERKSKEKKLTLFAQKSFRIENNFMVLKHAKSSNMQESFFLFAQKKVVDYRGSG